MKGNNCLLIWSPWTWNYGEILSLFFLVVAIFAVLWKPVHSTECTKQKYFVSIFGVPLNATVQCPMYFQWTVSDLCCYGKYDRFDQDPYCCYSDTYKLVLAVGVICLIVLGTSCIVFFCWAYSFPHHVLYVLTCGHFHLNNWMKRNAINGPYVDPSFYSGEPFWSRGASVLQPYPLRPMPPRIFYPAAPANIKFRWDSMAASSQMPLFIVASRQFTRNPYSARPSERSIPSLQQPGSDLGSRSSSITTLADAHHSNKYFPLLEFHVNMDEMEAAAELLEALKRIEEKGDKGLQIADIPEETTAAYDFVSTDTSERGTTAKDNRTQNILQDVEEDAENETSPILLSTSTIPDTGSGGKAFNMTDLHYNEPPVEADEYPIPNLVPSPFLMTPPRTAYSREDFPPKEVNRVEVPYSTPRLPGSIPEN